MEVRLGIRPLWLQLSEWGVARWFAVAMEPALVATLPPYHRLQAAQNRASAAAGYLPQCLVDSILSHLHHPITGPLHFPDSYGRVSSVEQGDAGSQGRNVDAVEVVWKTIGGDCGEVVGVFTTADAPCGEGESVRVGVRRDGGGKLEPRRP